METILVEKFPKYGDDWKTTGVGALRQRISELIKDISVIVVSKIDWDREKVRRKLIHIANYCMLLENNIRIRKD